jgi:hypothetical protein
VETWLEHALIDLGEPPIRELPAEVTGLLLQLQAPPRLAAHLRAVHDVAHEITAWVASTYPSLSFDREAVLYGATTHDIGKAVHVEELSGPGSLHEKAGRQLLLDAGIAPSLARFAATHASWTEPGITVEADRQAITIATREVAPRLARGGVVDCDGVADRRH